MEEIIDISTNAKGAEEIDEEQEEIQNGPTRQQTYLGSLGYFETAEGKVHKTEVRGKCEESIDFEEIRHPI